MSRLRVLVACAGAALVLAGIAGAANSGAFTDATGDARLAPDIGTLAVSNDDAGNLTFQITMAGGLPANLPGTVVGVGIDTDQNPDTGTVYYGSEVMLLFAGGTLHFGRANGADFSPAAPPPSLHGTISGNVATFTINAADLGLSPADGFNVFAITQTALDGDLAPDIRTYNYEQVAGTPPKPLGPDTRAPLDHAFKAKGVHGKVVELDYDAEDGRAQTADTIRVYRGAKVLRTIRFSMGDANPFFGYYAKWRVPRTVRGRLRYCVQSTDAAGNKSNVACAPLTIR
jgi:hypothetical protein